MPHAGLADQERPGDLTGLQTTEGPQRQSHLGVGAQRRMAGGEEQPEQIIGDRVGQVVVDGGHRVVLRFGGVPVREQSELGGQVLTAPVPVGGQVLRRAHQPGRRVIGDAVARPLGQGDHQGVLGQIFSGGEVAGDPGERGDQVAGLDPPDRLDRRRGAHLNRII